ncbi:MAG: tRNA (adenosine(37)-N6)-dimethylallyltransferase MiaA [Daejeonella sp.]
MAKTLIVIAGPTAIGKTNLAIRLADYYKTEIISADSRQFYREMSIGTAKPSEEELHSVKHHFINSHSIHDSFNAGDYEREVIKLLKKLFKDHDKVILVGGSGLFINAVINGFDDLPAASNETRKTLNGLLKEQGLLHLQEMLKVADPVYYNEVDLSNPQRIIRALEVCETTGKPFSVFRNKDIKTRPFRIIKIGLNTVRSKLYENINSRVDKMIRDGLVEEVESLLAYRELNPLKTVGYSELFDYFDGKYSLPEAIAMIKQNTRRFAKRQLTWFNKSDDIKWFGPDEFEKMISYLNSRLQRPEPAVQKS